MYVIMIDPNGEERMFVIGGVEIVSPEILKSCSQDVMVVVTSFRAEEITRQLDEMGIHKYYVMDGGKEYIRYRHQEMLLEYIRGEADRKGWVQFDKEERAAVVYKWWNSHYAPRNERESYLPFIAKVPRILDYGFGCGTEVLHLLLLGYDAYGVDVNEMKYAYTMQLINDLGYPSEWKNHFMLYDGETICFEDNTFDLVFSDQVLEHVPDCHASVKEMLRVCKRDGWVDVRCPNYDSSWEGHFLVDFGKPLRDNKEEFCRYFVEKGSNIDVIESLNFINTQDVYEMFEKSGYDVEITNQNYYNPLTGTSLLVKKR